MNALNLIAPDSAGIAYLEIDLPNQKVNKLSEAVMYELDALLDGDLKNKAIQALIIGSRKPGVFIAGADIDEIEKIKTADDAYKKSRQGQAIFAKLAALEYPTVAVIDGACLGGGLELALACSFRVVSDSPKTKLGLPEVNLGILPGWGGTQRLPRLVGLVPALNMILAGKPVTGSNAARIGLADQLVAHEFIAEAAREFTEELLAGKGRQRKSHALTHAWPARKLIFRKASETAIRKTKGHYPAVPAILALMAETASGRLDRGLDQEARAFSALVNTPVSRNLIGLYHTDQALKKERGVEGEVEIKPLERAAVLGAGVMGGGIAWLFSKSGRSVRMKDISWDSIAKGFARAADYYAQLVKLRKMKPSWVTMNFHRISGTLDYTGFSTADVVVEAIVEKMVAKKSALVDLENEVPRDAVICSNTSALSITEMATVLRDPERFVGMHFFNPVNRMPLVEVIAGERSSASAVASVVALAREMGKTPVVVGDRPGFLVNRILIPYLNEAGLLLEEGVAFERVDRLMEEFGMPMGPFRLADETGVDVGLKVIQELEEAFGPRLRTAGVLHKFINAGLVGRKVGKGFYTYAGKRRSANPEAVKLLAGYKRKEVSDGEIVDRLILTMLNEAALCLEEGVIDRADYLDMALIMGIGFPPFRGGLLAYADTRGINTVVDRLETLRAACGDRFAPAQRLRELASAGTTFRGGEDLKGAHHG